MFKAPLSAFLTFMGGMLFVCLILTIYIVAKSKREIREKETSFLPFLFCIFLTIPLFVLPIKNYYYINKDGIFYNYLFEFSEREYLWSEVEEYDRIFLKKNNITTEKEHIFTLKNGDTVTLPHSYEFFKSSRFVRRALNHHGATINEATIVEE